MKKYWLIAIAVFLGACLRLISLADIPQGFTWDEAALGYNAFSILKTGRDEFGKLFPVIFKSFGDYKPGLYVYTAVPSIALFGLNEFATRLPSALSGVAAILGLYLLVNKLTKNNLLASLSAISLSLSPWHIHFSRGAWETNLFTTLLLFSIYYFLRFLDSESTPFPSLILAAATLVTYQAAKMLTPLIFILLIIVYRKEVVAKVHSFVSTKSNLLKITPLLVFTLWIYFGSMLGDSGNRLARLSIFTYKPPVSEQTKSVDNYNGYSIRLFHSQIQTTAQSIFNRYLYYFSPEVLFYEGSVITVRGHIPRSGMLNPFDFVWLVAGIAYLSINRKEKWVKLLLGLLLIAPLPGSLTLSEYSTVRSLFMTIPLAFLSGSGMQLLFSKSKILFSCLMFIFIFFFVYACDLYFSHSKFFFPKEFLYGYKQAIQYIKENPDSRIVFTDVNGQPYIYYLFYTAYNPSLYQKENNFISGGLDVGKVSRAGKAEFHQFGFGDILTYKNTIFVGHEGNLPNSIDFSNPVIDFYRSVSFPDGTEAYRVVKTKP